MITVVLSVFGFLMLALVAVLIIAGLLASYGWIGRKTGRLALTLQGHTDDPLDGFQIADDYPPKPQS